MSFVTDDIKRASKYDKADTYEVTFSDIYGIRKETRIKPGAVPKKNPNDPDRNEVKEGSHHPTSEKLGDDTYSNDSKNAGQDGKEGNGECLSLSAGFGVGGLGRELADECVVGVGDADKDEGGLRTKVKHIFGRDETQEERERRKKDRGNRARDVMVFTAM